MIFAVLVSVPALWGPEERIRYDLILMFFWWYTLGSHGDPQFVWSAQSSKNFKLNAPNLEIHVQNTLEKSKDMATCAK